MKCMANLDTSLRNKGKYYYGSKKRLYFDFAVSRLKAFRFVLFFLIRNEILQTCNHHFTTTIYRNQRHSLDSTQVHNTDDYGCFDEKQYEEIHHLSHQSLKRWRDAVLPAWLKVTEKQSRTVTAPFITTTLHLKCWTCHSEICCCNTTIFVGGVSDTILPQQHWV